MLSEIIKLCKRTAGWIKNNDKELYLASVVVLVAVIGFGLGRLSKIREEKTPITIKDRGLIAVSASSVDINKTVENKADKIFVASRNGKKYYYAWCESANVIKEQNRIWFSTQEEAERAGYEPAANCKGLK